MDYFLNITYELINHTKYISYRKYTNYKLINYYGYTPKKLFTDIRVLNTHTHEFLATDF